ncbi:MAG: TIGR03435 family protein [Janthinobacterium lividum]
MTELYDTRPNLQAMPLKSIFHQLTLLLAVTVASTSACCAQMPSPPTASGQGYEGTLPQFDVISVKPHKPGDQMMRVRWGKSEYAADNLTLKDLVAAASGVKGWLVFDLPPWGDSAKWDVAAKVSAPDLPALEKLTAEQRREMIGAILKERFGLVVHMEKKVQPVYAMTVLPQGAKLKQSPSLPPPAEGEKPKDTGGSWSIGHGTLRATRMTMLNLAENLSYQVQRSVIDKTGLTGLYDLELKWTPEDRANDGDDGTGDAPPAIFEAVKEQLGLKLTAAKEPVPTVVVDRAEQPQDN